MNQRLITRRLDTASWKEEGQGTWDSLIQRQPCGKTSPSELPVRAEP